MSAPLLQVRDLTVEYRTARGAVQAVRGVDLDVARGQVVALIGESGSGKSTVAQACVGMLPSAGRVTAGQLLLTTDAGPLELAAASERRLRQVRWSQVAYMSQAAINGFNPVQTVGQHFIEVAEAHGAGRGRAVRAHATELLDAVRLDGSRVWRSYPHELSGGMRQRAMLALALQLSPRLIILDEPTTALDVLTQRSILQVLREVRERLDLALLFITHDIGTAAEIADTVVTLYAGAVCEASTVTGLRNGGARHPYTDGLVTAIPSVRGGVSARPIPGSPPDMVNPPGGCAFHPRCPRATSVCATTVPPLTLHDEDPRGGSRAACHHPLPVRQSDGGRAVATLRYPGGC